MALTFSESMFEGLGQPVRAELDIRDCEVEGEIPAALNGTFYRVGPDFQYPPRVGNNIPLDGDGHVSMFRFANGHVDLKTRFVQTQRFKAQAEARRALFGTYRNPRTDLPQVQGMNRSTGNTHVVFHAGKLYALKEDSPPVLLDPHTLETLDDAWNFDGKLSSLTFTAHPKIDPVTGEMIAFGYEAKGEGSNDVAVYGIDPRGGINWEAWIKVPYAGMLHDFAVTQTHVAFFVMPLVTSMEQLRQGGAHFAWDSQLPSWFGVMRRGGDGKDVRWFKGPERNAIHVMGAFSDGDRVFVDMDISQKNSFSFLPHLHGEHFNPDLAQRRITRVSVDLSKRADSYSEETMYPDYGTLPRIDERYQTVPYRYGFMPVVDRERGESEKSLASLGLNSIKRFDHATRRTSSFYAGEHSTMEEPVFVPRRAGAAEGDGYVIAIAHRTAEHRSDLVIVDTEQMNEGAVATVRLPLRINVGIHGSWVDGQELAR
jgi:carotenoid cleavage dioxygenase